ncbi:MAG TPA: hypothetical protein VF384_01585 [Planctomycetota bacterium]
MAHHQVIDAARKNGSGAGRDRWFEEIIGCSDRGRHFGVRRAANDLLHLLASSHWWISSGPKIGGLGGGGRPPDMTMHVTLAIQGDRQYHLRLDARGHVFEIVRGGDRSTSRPWLAPGQPVD